MELEFRVDKCVPSVDYKSLFASLKAMAARFIVCFENKDKNGKSVKEHYHGYMQCEPVDGKQDRYILDKARRFIKKFTNGKSSDYFLRQKKGDTLTALAYCTKQQDVVDQHNISYTMDELQEKWHQMKDEWNSSKESKKEYKEDIINYILEKDYKTPPTLDEVKLEVAKKMVSDKKLPSMGKVRAYTLYVVLTLNMKISEYDLYKML